MASVEKSIEKMKTQTRGIRYVDAAKVLNHFGYILVRKKGLHRHFRNDAGDLMVLKEENPLKISYINEFHNSLFSPHHAIYSCVKTIRKLYIA